MRWFISISAFQGGPLWGGPLGVCIKFTLAPIFSPISHQGPEFLLHLFGLQGLKYRPNLQTCRRISVLALFQRILPILSVFSVFFHFSAPKSARKCAKICRLYTCTVGKDDIFALKTLYRLYRCTVSRCFSASTLISARDQREILFTFMKTARNQRENAISRCSARVGADFSAQTKRVLSTCLYK